MTAGRRSTTLCLAGCSARAGAPPSSPPTISAAGCWRSASEPGSRCRNTRPTCASSAPIFRKACCAKPRRAVADLRLKNVEGLAVMDAEKLEFPDNSFDVVMAQYVVTAVPNPEAALDEFARVLRPGGEMILLSRVSADAGMRRFIEQPAAAGGASARLPHRFRLVALYPMGGRGPWRGIGRASPGTAVRSLLADPFPQAAPGCCRVIREAAGALVPALSPNGICHYDDVICRTSNPCKQTTTTFFGGENDQGLPGAIANPALG